MEIQSALAAVAEDHGVKIIFACESGSRAWGIESPDSDWDVRFIYQHPLEWYLRLTPGRDVIETQDGVLDLSGFDLRKAFLLAGKSNPSVLEWLASPIVYNSGDETIQLMARLMERQFCPSSLMHHYTSLATRQYKAYWSEGQPVRFKKYLYAIRPILAVDWMVEHGYAMPPIRFDELRDRLISYSVEDELDELLQLKFRSSETGGEGRYPKLDRWIEVGIERSRQLACKAPKRQPDMDALQNLFWNAVMRGCKGGNLIEEWMADA